METLNAAALSVRELNSALRALPSETAVRIAGFDHRHNLAVGLTRHLLIEVDSDAGYYLGGLGDGPEIVVNGSVGWGVGENLMSGLVRVRGSASQAAASSAHGGTVVVEADASLRTGISLKGATVLVGGDVGAMCGFMAQAGTILIGGNAGDNLGDSLYEAVIYVAGSVASLGTDARFEELTERDIADARDLVKVAGFDHVSAEDLKKVVSARELYHFSSANHQAY